VSSISGQRIVVAGSGALGSAIAWRLQTAGANVTLADAAAPGDNASGIAAGMLAPAFEAVLDESSRDRFALLKAARDAWPAFVEGLEPFGGRLERCGAIWVGDEASQAETLAALRDTGAQADRLSAEETARLSPGLTAPAGSVFTSDDWRLDAGRMLAAMRDGFLAEGGQTRSADLASVADGAARLEDGEVLRADAVVLATGLAPESMSDAPPEARRLHPIKGQILRTGSGPTSGPAVRAKGVYVAPASGGAAVGATMEQGRGDRDIDPEVTERLRSLGAQLFPALATASVSAEAGVRASSPDGLPMAGRSSRAGIWLALGARRNGWLLAPMLAEVIAQGLAGEAAGPWAQLFDPLRFEP
jgi:glycine oxidase